MLHFTLIISIRYIVSIICFILRFYSRNQVTKYRYLPSPVISISGTWSNFEISDGSSKFSNSNCRKLRSRKGNETVDQMVQNMPEFCELHIICEGKEVMLEKQIVESPYSRVSENVNIVENNNSNDDTSESLKEDEFQNNGSFPCSCFTPKARA